MSEAKKKTKGKSQPLYLRAQAWRTWEACALSLILKDETPFPPEADEDADAAEGTLIHAAIESDLKGVAREKLTVEMEAVVNFAVRFTKSEAGDNAIKTETFHEQKVLGVRQACRTDAEIDAGDVLTIIDFKTGWKINEAETQKGGKIIPNTQLKMGAHLARKQSHKAWRGIIVNARMNSIKITGPHPFEKDYLKNLAADAKKRVAAVQTQVGNHCAYCPALAVCKPVRASIKKWVKPGADDGIKNRKDDWSEVLNLIKPATNLFKRIKSDALKYIDLGGEIPGVSVELSGGTRVWPNDLSDAALADRLGVTVDDLTTQKLLSPAQAEEKGVPAEKIKAVAIQPLRRGLKISVAKKGEGK